MVNNTIHASENPDLVNSLVQSISAEEVQVAAADLLFPVDTEVTLPGGFISPTGEVIKVAEVRELNGKDEEVISKATNPGKIFTTILSRGVVKVGKQSVDDVLLDSLFIGDREALLLGIYKATFGLTAEIAAWCDGCRDYKTVGIDIDSDIKVKPVNDIVEDSLFLVKGRTNEFTISLPTGAAQREVIEASDRTTAELNTVLLYNTVRKINGKPVISRKQIEELGIQDRRAILAELSNRSFGPVFENQVVKCPDCESEVVVPINLGTLFRF